MKVTPANGELDRVVKELRESVIESTIKAPVRLLAECKGNRLMEETQEV
jgi:hypothetical protein